LLHRYDKDKEYDGTSTVKQSEASDYKNNAPDKIDNANISTLSPNVYRVKTLKFIRNVVTSSRILLHRNIYSQDLKTLRLNLDDTHTRKTSKTHRYLIRLLIAKKLS
jgi:hypothetical protein